MPKSVKIGKNNFEYSKKKVAHYCVYFQIKLGMVFIPIEPIPETTVQLNNIYTTMILQHNMCNTFKKLHAFFMMSSTPKSAFTIYTR